MVTSKNGKKSGACRRDMHRLGVWVSPPRYYGLGKRGGLGGMYRLGLFCLLVEYFEHLDCREGYACARAEDGGNAGFVEEVVVLSRDDTACCHKYVFTAKLL